MDSSFGMMTGYGFRSALLVARTQYHSLMVINLVGVAIAMVVVVPMRIGEFFACRRCRKIQSAQRESGNPASTDVTGVQADEARLLTKDDGRGYPEPGDSPRYPSSGKSHPPLIAEDYRERWPIHSTLYCLAQLPKRKEWVDAMRRAKDLKHQCEICPRGIEPILVLETHMRNLRHLWTDANAEDSTLGVMLGASLGQLAHLHARVYNFVPNSVQTTMTLEKTLLDPEVQAAMSRRWQAQVMESNGHKYAKLLMRDY